MDRSFQPADIQVNKQLGTLAIVWQDEHTSVYPFGLLRAACPCAQCRGGHEHMRSSPDPDVFTLAYPIGPAAQLSDVEVVGNYALSFTWADGHHFGIYHWAYLRDLCPCRICHPEEKENPGSS